MDEKLVRLSERDSSVRGDEARFGEPYQASMNGCEVEADLVGDGLDRDARVVDVEETGEDEDVLTAQHVSSVACFSLFA